MTTIAEQIDAQPHCYDVQPRADAGWIEISRFYRARHCLGYDVISICFARHAPSCNLQQVGAVSPDHEPQIVPFHGAALPTGADLEQLLSTFFVNFRGIPRVPP